MKCPKCGYTRKMGESVPDWQCPSCGVAYAKANAGAEARARPRSASGGGSLFLKLLVVVALAGAAWVVAQGIRPGSKPAGQELAQTGVVMYSLTTCGFCNQKRAQLTAAGIPFVEYFVDTDKGAFDELVRKLEATGMRGGGIGTPTFDVNGKMLLNNPSLDTIRKHL